MTDHIDDLKSLHTILVDSKHGYEEALEDADGRGLTGMFSQMIALRTSHIAALRAHLPADEVSDKGGIMTTVNKAIMSIRSLFGGLDESVLPGLIDGEKRIASYYDAALESGSDDAEKQLLMEQRQKVMGMIGEMERQHAAAA